MESKTTKFKDQHAQEHCVKQFMEEYLKFPSANNLEAAIGTMKVYQMYWMEARK